MHKIQRIHGTVTQNALQLLAGGRRPE